MHILNVLFAAGFAFQASAGVCWTSPLGILLGAPPRKRLFGPPAQQGDCNLPLQNGGRPAPPPPPPAPPMPAPAPLTIYVTTTTTTTVQGPTITACSTTISACTATITACTSTETVSACTSTVTACTSTETIYSLNPASVAAGNAACQQAYGTARPSALFNYNGRPKCCAPIKEFDSLGNVKAQCLGGP